jgi:hypothetical protein
MIVIPHDRHSGLVKLYPDYAWLVREKATPCGPLFQMAAPKDFLGKQKRDVVLIGTTSLFC